MIRFTKDATPKVEKGAKSKTFKAGDVVNFYEVYGEDDPAGMNEDEFEKNRSLRARASEQHWITRGYAEEYDEDESKPKAKAEPKAEAKESDYEAMHVDELHKLAGERNIEGRSALTTKADLVKALEKDDKTKAKAKTAPQPAPPKPS